MQKGKKEKKNFVLNFVMNVLGKKMLRSMWKNNKRKKNPENTEQDVNEKQFLSPIQINISSSKYFLWATKSLWTIIKLWADFRRFLSLNEVAISFKTEKTKNKISCHHHSLFCFIFSLILHTAGYLELYGYIREHFEAPCDILQSIYIWFFDCQLHTPKS